MSEISDRADEIRALAQNCETVLDLAKTLRWPIQSAASANEQLQLGLAEIKVNRFGAPRAAQPSPKPQSKKPGGR